MQWAELKELDAKIEEQREKAGDVEVRDGMLARADFLARIGDKVRVLLFVRSPPSPSRVLARAVASCLRGCVISLFRLAAVACCSTDRSRLHACSIIFLSVCVSLLCAAGGSAEGVRRDLRQDGGQRRPHRRRFRHPAPRALLGRPRACPHTHQKGEKVRALSVSLSLFCCDALAVIGVICCFRWPGPAIGDRNSHAVAAWSVRTSHSFVACSLVEKGGDWERRNLLNVYEATFLLMTREVRLSLAVSVAFVSVL